MVLDIRGVVYIYFFHPTSPVVGIDTTESGIRSWKKKAPTFICIYKRRTCTHLLVKLLDTTLNRIFMNRIVQLY